MTDEEYWEERAAELEKEMLRSSYAQRERILKAYLRACKDIEKEIEQIYRTMMGTTKMTREELNALMSVRETEEYYKRLREQLAEVEDADERREILAKLNAPAYKYRISRWQALEASVEARLKQLRLEEIRAGEAAIRRGYEAAYYKSIFEVQKKVGFYFSFDKLPEKAVDLALKTPWHEAVYSERVWGNVDKLREVLDEILPAALMSGRSVKKVAEELSKAMDSGIGEAMRLIRTELNHYHNEAAFLSYQNSGVKKYRYHATLDKRTCKRCGFWDMKIILMQEKKTGYNFPPLHPNDRCTVSPVIDGATEKSLLPRMSRDPKTGKKVQCPPGTTWEKWQNTYAKYVLPKTGNDSDAYLQKALLGDCEGKELIIPKGAQAEKVRIIAGKWTSTEIRASSDLVKKYGGEAWQWEKKGGIIVTGNYNYDVHWYELNGVQYDIKSKSIKRVK